MPNRAYRQSPRFYIFWGLFHVYWQMRANDEKESVKNSEEFPWISKKQPKDWQADPQKQRKLYINKQQKKKRKERHHLALPFPQKCQALFLLWKCPENTHQDWETQEWGPGDCFFEWAAFQGKALFFHCLQCFRTIFLFKNELDVCRGSHSCPMIES